MAKSYCLQIKISSLVNEKKFYSLNDALSYFKKVVLENCNINKELDYILNEPLPSLNYRKSVYNYLNMLFYKKEIPSYKMIDYSDYDDEPCIFDSSEYIDVEQDFADEASELDLKLGFTFCVGLEGMHLIFTKKLLTIIHFEKTKDSLFFVFEPFDKSRKSIEIKLLKNEDYVLPKITGSIYPVMLFSLFTNGLKCPIKANSKSNSRKGLVYEMSRYLLLNVNQKQSIPSKSSFTERVIKDYINVIKKFGFDINEDNKEYYLPPFICKKDCMTVFSCIENSSLSNICKDELSKKFMFDSGYLRYAKDDLEESNIHIPSKKKWCPNDYSFIIYQTLRLYPRFLPITSIKKENLHNIIQTNYQIDKMPKRQTLSDNIKSMIAINLPIRKSKTKVSYLFTYKELLKEDVDKIILCIEENTCIDSKEKDTLIKKIKSKFIIGTY